MHWRLTHAKERFLRFEEVYGDIRRRGLSIYGKIFMQLEKFGVEKGDWRGQDIK